MVNLYRCNGSCNTLNDPSDKICAENKIEDVNLSVFNMTTRKNESKTLAKHASFDCKCKFDGRKRKLKQKWNNDKCWFECKNTKKYHVCEKIFI